MTLATPISSVKLSLHSRARSAPVRGRSYTRLLQNLLPTPLTSIRRKPTHRATRELRSALTCSLPPSPPRRLTSCSVGFPAGAGTPRPRVSTPPAVRASSPIAAWKLIVVVIGACSYLHAEEPSWAIQVRAEFAQKQSEYKSK